MNKVLKIAGYTAAGAVGVFIAVNVIAVSAYMVLYEVDKYKKNKASKNK